MPGGGAEVFSPRVRKIIADRKVPAEVWLDVHREAHGQGLRTNATLLFGHFETPEEQVDHMARPARPAGRHRRLPGLHPAALPAGQHRLRVPARARRREEKLRTIAVARLFLDSFPHIKGHWVMLGEEITSEALGYGLDDLSGTLTEERIAHATTVQTPLGLSQERMESLIRGRRQGPGRARHALRARRPRRGRLAVAPRPSAERARYTLAEASALIGPLDEAHPRR